MPVEMLTYDEVAERLNISPEAARSLAKRLHLPRAVSLDGRARVTVDLAAIEHKPRAPVSRKTRIETLQAEIARLEATAATLRADFEHERERADGLTAALLKAADETCAAKEAAARLEGEVAALAKAAEETWAAKAAAARLEAEVATLAKAADETWAAKEAVARLEGEVAALRMGAGMGAAAEPTSRLRRLAAAVVEADRRASR
jgi:chromosome segregation ATPase